MKVQKDVVSEMVIDLSSEAGFLGEGAYRLSLPIRTFEIPSQRKNNSL